MKTTTKEDLSYEVGELLKLPINTRKGTAYKVVSAMVKAMAAALHRGESIRIDGFGIFRLVEWKPRRKEVTRVTSQRKWRKGDFREVITVVPRPRISFQPSKALLRYISS